MTIKELAAAHNLVKRRDSEGDWVIPGRVGKSHIYQYSTLLMAALVSPAKRTAHYWLGALKVAAAHPGMAVLQNGDIEGTISFHPENRLELKAAFKLVRVRKKRRISEEEKARMVARLEAARIERKVRKLWEETAVRLQEGPEPKRGSKRPGAKKPL